MEPPHDPLPRTDPSATLRGRRWIGQSTYRVLSYYFSVRWTWAEGGRVVSRVLERFAVPPDRSEERNPPTPGLPARYSIVTRGRGRDRRYELFYAERLLFGTHEPGSLMDTFFWHVNSETIRRTGDFLLIHAGALATPDGDGVLILGASGSGKTTLTAALVRAGFGYLSDDAAPIDPVTRRLYPYAKALNVKDADPKGPHILPEELRPGCVSDACDVRFVIAHRYDPGSATTLTSISPAAGIVELTRNALNMSLYGTRALPLLSDVARGARHYTLVSAGLDEAVAAVVELTGATVEPNRTT